MAHLAVRGVSSGVLLSLVVGVVFHNAYVVYDQLHNLYMTSNPVPLKLVK